MADDNVIQKIDLKNLRSRRDALAVAGTAVDLSIKHRPMTGPERDFAARVFGPTLPIDRIVLTNLLGIGRKAFTMPGIGNAILVNLGAGFDNPVGWAGFGAFQAKITDSNVLIFETVNSPG